MKNNVLIITGGSKGIGLALANHYHHNNFKVYSLARTVSNDLPFHQLKIDLVNESVETVFTSILNELDLTNIKKITLINNAGRLGKIGNIENISLDDISKSIRLNVTIPLQLTKLFIAEFKSVNAVKTIFNISSGAALNAYQGWSTYCTSKAGLDMLTKAISVEQKEVKYPVKCLGIRPGVVATNMQEQIRKSSKDDFVLLQRFIDLHENNQLSNPKDVAHKIYVIDQTNRFDSGETIDLRDL